VETREEMMDEKEAMHRIRRMIARAKWEEHLYRCEMISQKLTGIFLSLLLIGAWHLLGELEYGLMFLPMITLTMMLFTTDKNIKRMY
jgi:hypothetical protein